MLKLSPTDRNRKTSKDSTYTTKYISEINYIGE